MSTDRPPSPKNLTTTINSNKIDFNKILSRKTISPTTNMVLSAIPLDAGHVVMQQSGQRLPLVKGLMHQPLQQTQLNNLLSANFTSATTQIDRNTSPSKIINATNSNTITASSISTSSPKYLLFHPNNTGHFNDFIGQSNGVGNIVIVATEQMDAAHPENSSIIHTNGSIINSTTGVSNNASNGNTPPDEDLTSLTWLHDKNLIKGLVPCSAKNGSAARQITSNSLILTNTNTIAAVKSCSNDLIEDNTEEMEQHAINLKSQKATNFSQQQHVQFPIINKNCSNILSPPSTFQAMPTVAVSGSSAQLLQDHLNSNILGATTTVHIGPSGTTTVVEYKSNSGLLSSPNGITSSTITSSINSTSPSIVSNGKIIQNVATTSSTGSLNNYSVASLHHNQQQQQQSTTHHPHKKYLREQMNGFDQSNVNKNNLSNLSTNNNLNKNLNLNINEQQYTQIIKSPNSANINSNQYSNLTVSQSPNKINQMEETSTNEYLLNTPGKSNQKLQQDQSLIITNDYDGDSLKDFDISSGNKQQQNYICSPNSSAGMSPSKQKHPTNVPYDPHVHTNSKPPYSFSSLIFMAIEDSPEKALPVKEIYAWIVHHFPYFKTAPTGWKNSVRHNLSLNKSFLKVEKAPNMGKGSLWRVEQMQRPNLMQALQRSPFFPCSAVDKFSTMLSQKNLMSPPPQAKVPNNSNGNVNTNNISSLQSDSDDSSSYVPVKSNLDATLFPKLSKMMKEMVGKNGGEDEVDGPDGDDESSFGNNLSNNSLDYYSTVANGKPVAHAEKNNCADSIDDVNAATAMLALKHGSKVFAENFTNGSPVITNSPSDDHTYSAGNANTSHRESVPFTDAKSLNSSGSSTFNSQNASSNSSNCASSDAAYESSSEESHNVTPEELEEKRRVEEGVDALLSLSLMFDKNSKPSPIKRTASTTVEEEHISSYMENIPHLNGKGSLASNLDEGYSTQSYYNNLIPTNTTLLSTTFSYPPKKLKQSKGLRAKIKRKTAWIR